jgi:hypothetical protein
MHQSEKPGYLLINGSPPSYKALYRLLHLHHNTLGKPLHELLEKGVLTKEGETLVCPRMVKDQEVRQMRREVGRKGGNPALVNQKVKAEVNPRSQKSEARKRNTTAVSVFSLPEWMPKDTWALFLDHRKKVKAPVSEKAFPSFVGKFEKLKDAGWPPDKVVDVMTEKGWRWFKAEWVQETPPGKANKPPERDEHALKVDKWKEEKEAEGKLSPAELEELIGFKPDFGNRGGEAA